MQNAISKTLITLGLAGALTATASAQTSMQPQAEGVRTAQNAWRHRRDDGVQASTRPTERVEARLAYVKGALKITDAQQPLWDGYANLLRSRAADREKRMDEWRARAAQNGGRPSPTQQSAIARLERQQQFHAHEISRLNEQLQVEKPLYAALTAEQRQVADKLLSTSGHRGQPGRRMQRGA